MDLKFLLLETILLEVNSNDEDSYEIFEDQIKNLEKSHGWDELSLVLISFLKSAEYKLTWYNSICVLCWGFEDGKPCVINWKELVANFYTCLQYYSNLGQDELVDSENLIWSASIKLKDVDYLSDWDPLKDNEIKKYMGNF